MMLSDEEKKRVLVSDGVHATAIDITDKLEEARAAERRRILGVIDGVENPATGNDFPNRAMGVAVEIFRKAIKEAIK